MKKMLNKIRKLPKYLESNISKFSRYISRPSANPVTNQYPPKVIVSLTSFPDRINEIHLCVKTLMNQTFKPDMIILWLAEEQFPGKERDLPKKLLHLVDMGLTIRWTDDLRSYKKLIPTLVEFPESVIITTDDDVYYPKNCLERLMDTHKKYPNTVCCLRAATVKVMNNGIERKHPSMGNKYKEPSFLHQQTGVGGVLYPPHCFFQDVLEKDIFMNIAKTNDDLWFWIMGVLGGSRVYVIGDNEPDLYYVGESQRWSLTAINDQGDNLYNKQLHNLINKYPQLLKILQEEYDKLGAEKI